MKMFNWFRKNKGQGIGAVALGGYRSRQISLDTLHGDQMISSGVRCVAHMIGQLSWSSTDPVVDKFLRRPNSTTTTFEFFSELIYSLLTFGIAPQYVIKTDSSVSMIPLDASRFKEKIGADGSITYEYGSQGRERRTYSPSEVCVFRDLYLPNGSVFSRVESAREKVAALKLVDKSIKSILENGVVASWIIKSGVQLTEEAKKEFLATLKSQLSNLDGRNSGGVLLVSRDMEVTREKTGVSPADSELMTLRGALIREIASALGVPPFLLGTDHDAKFNNFTARQNYLYKDTLAPLLENLEQKLSNFLNATVVCDRWALESGDFRSQSDIVAQLVGRPVWSANEGRQRLGMSPVDDDGANELASGSIAPTKPDYESDVGRGSPDEE